MFAGIEKDTRDFFVLPRLPNGRRLASTALFDVCRQPSTVNRLTDLTRLRHPLLT